MPLVEHIRELRSRLLRTVIGLVLGVIVGFVFFEPIWAVLQDPYCQLPIAQDPDGGCKLGIFRIFASFLIRLKVALIVGVVLSSPIWLYQLWAFVTPGLHRNERRWTVAFLGTAIPLFFGGAALAYFVLDKGLAILLSFAPQDANLLIGIDDYLSFVTRMLIVFGVSFELPLLVLMLNLAGILSYERIARWRRMIIFGAFVFAAVATPSGDPFSMLALGVPMIILFEIAGQIARIHDRRKAAREAASPYAELSDDEASPLDLDESYGLEDDRR
ncbi:MAG: twin-arginine translocase subunit TatC [Streptosporangiales bacterium]|nr:twin-arginine translocase subunit TatC [Streptosporangiales bacterium]